MSMKNFQEFYPYCLGEHANRPATFSYPRWSFLGDWVMWKDILTGKIKF